MSFLIMLAAAITPIELGEIEARLFYKETGRLSENVLGRSKPFTFWNTIIGEGDAEESADDLLISVRMGAGKFGTPDEIQRFAEGPVELVAVGHDGTVLARRVHTTVLTSNEGIEHKVLWLNNVGCAGDIRITATFEGQKKTALLQMACGE